MTTEDQMEIVNEIPEKKLKYPKSVFFIISNEFCERFSYYGMRGVLPLYLKNSLKYNENSSTIIYHVFVMLCYFTPVFGGIMADAWIGKYKTILYVSLLYAAGNIVLSVGSVEGLALPHKELSLLGLFMIAVGTGGIKPCVSSFGGDQFVIPQQERELQRFFSVFYFSINAGSVISSFLTPILRQYHCLGSDTDCYPLAFGLPAALMVAAVVFFVLGSPMYKHIKPEGNIVLDVSGCVGHAVVRKIKSKEKKKNWLDYADDKYDSKLIADIKVLMSLIVLFSPTIVFWALYEQQGDKWTFQASRMNGDLGWYTIIPDQMQTLNAVLVLVFIPLFEYIVYPILAKLRLVRTSLQKLIWGGFLAALAFVVSGILELKINENEPTLPGSGQSELLLYNTFNCPARVEGIGNTINISPLSFTDINGIPAKPTNVTITSECGGSWSGNFELQDEEVSSYLLLKETTLVPFLLNQKGSSEMLKSESTYPKLKILYSGANQLSIFMTSTDNTEKFIVESGKHQSEMHDMPQSGKYSVTIDGKAISDITMSQGGVYILMLEDEANNMVSQLLTIVEPNSINMLWQIPQYIIITAAEIMFSITGIEFSYSESPESMRSVISSLWLLTDSFGNIIVLVIAGFKMADEAIEMFIYAGLMAVTMIVFIYLARRYTISKKKAKELEESIAVLEQTKI
ncbi:solute carrier family 15 member 1 [Halyomorpha halys]|uniref:solute carrier family 15 member 1 n=1 Tax=Halyomorpha halys TaxID=286706 RepID=UPI0006D5209A|nr:peptide transporter family 1-like [Halyomorpha halys]